MRKSLVFVLVLALTASLCLGLCACGSSETSGTTVQSDEAGGATAQAGESSADESTLGGETEKTQDSSKTDDASGSSEPQTKADGSTVKPESEVTNMATDKATKVNVVMESGGKFVIELYPQYAPATVENFVGLVKEGFYDGLTFHRIVDGFMAQGGDPAGTGSGNSGKPTIKGEFSGNGFAQNTLSHTRGVISMARTSIPDSASTQFFICYDDCSFLDGQYAAFGKVVEGMDVVDGFLEVERTYNSSGERAVPVEPVRILNATIVE